MTDLQSAVEAAWEARDTVSTSTTGKVRDAVEETLSLLDAGQVRVAEKVDGEWRTNQWVKQAILLSFRLAPNTVHISGGAGIGGVLEPLQANPTIIEDDCFIGARSEVAEGVIIGQGSVLSMGVFLTASTTIIDRKTGERFRGQVPPYSVVVPGSMPSAHEGGPNLYCAVIVKTVDAQTRSKTGINDLLRD